MDRKQDIASSEKRKAEGAKPMQWVGRDLKVNIHGTTAIVAGTMVDTDKPSERFRHLDVWIQRAGRGRLRAVPELRLPPHRAVIPSLEFISKPFDCEDLAAFLANLPVERVAEGG